MPNLRKKEEKIRKIIKEMDFNEDLIVKCVSWYFKMPFHIWQPTIFTLFDSQEKLLKKLQRI